MVAVLVPSHDDPAGQAKHAVCVSSESPPDVMLPAAHVEHVSAPSREYRMSAPHAVFTLVPSHEYPAGHGTQAVCPARCIAPAAAASTNEAYSAPFPAVYDPTAHVRHLVFRTPVEYVLSAVHGTHALLPVALLGCVPGPQSRMRLDPPHSAPSGHARHSARVSLVPPFV